uniref:Pyridine nucleotide-disulfide oxidoreductase domain-containing protein 1 n=1 Tax=Panagrellus redivivus TaxID=6233 RepID=A0A7E4V9K3_PANRE
MPSPSTIVVGGGVAGVCAVQELVQLLESEASTLPEVPPISFICGKGGFVKVAENVNAIGEVAESFTVTSKPAGNVFPTDWVQVIQEDVVSWDPTARTIRLSNATALPFDKLIIATGARPVTVFDSEHVITLRDLDTIENLKHRLPTTRRVLLVGNGGIASELAYELKNVEIVWAVRHPSIGATYFDKQAATFFQSRLHAGRPDSTTKLDPRKRYTVENNNHDNGNGDGPSTSAGCALGPHWLGALDQGSVSDYKARKVHVIPEVEIDAVFETIPSEGYTSNLPSTFAREPSNVPWKVNARLSNGETLGADLIILGLGVTPNTDVWLKGTPQLRAASDGGLLVDSHMQTSIPGVYAVGDVCTPGAFTSTHWSHLRLWTQARIMGTYVARVIVLGDIEPDICFDLFTHVTSFFGYDVILLGDFAGEKLETPYDAHVRCSPDDEYIKVLVKNDRVHGAVLIGDVTLAETFQNLILNQTDIRAVEDDLLNPLFDLEDYYD